MTKRDVINPMDGSVAGSIELASREQVLAMVDKAAASQPAWEALTLTERGAMLNKLADLLEENDEKIGGSIMREMGKPIMMAKTECHDGAFLLRGYVEKAKHFYGEVLSENQPGMENDLIFTKREAIGVVACVIPFNYPIELTFHKVAPALICGNTCVVKVPSQDGLSVLMLSDLCREAGIPEGVIQFFGAERDVVNECVFENPKVDIVAMTGSTEAGLKIAERTSKTLKHTLLELGGNDPIVIFDDVDPAKAAAEIAEGRSDSNGQTCCGTKRMIVQDTIKDKVIEELIKILDSWKVGDPADEDTIISCLVSESAAIKAENQVKQTVEAGAKIVYGKPREGARFYPVILDDVTPDMDIAKDMEVFAMTFPIISFHTEEEAVKIANATKYGLSSGVMSEDMQRAFRVARQIKAGGAVVNGNGLYRHFEQPFGGMKKSGLGNEGISTTLNEFTQVKSYIVKGAWG